MNVNIANVTARFAQLSGLQREELSDRSMLIADACGYVEAHCRVTQPDEHQCNTLEMLASVYALRLYELCNVNDAVTSFSAGDVKLTSSGAASDRGQRLWEQLCREHSDLLDCGNFLFGRM